MTTKQMGISSLMVGIALGLALAAAGPFTASADEFVAAPYTSDHTLSLQDGREIRYVATHHYNANGEREVIIEHIEHRHFAPDTRKVVLIGRDLNDDGLYDAWFYMGQEGVMEGVDLPAHEDDGWDAASEVIRAHTDLNNRWVAGVFLDGLLSKISITQAHSDNLMMRLASEEVELVDFEIRAKRIQKLNPKAPELLVYYETLSDGWADISDSIKIRDQFIAGAEDLALYVGAGYLLKGLGYAGRWAGSRIAESEAGAALIEIYEKYAAKVAAKVAEIGDHACWFRNTAGRLASGAASKYEFMTMAVRDRVSFLIRALRARGQMGRLAAKALDSTVHAAVDYAGITIKNLPYTSWTQFLQLVAEVAESPEKYYDPNPIVMTKKLFTDRDLLQDFSYMTAETIITSTIIDRNHRSAKGFVKAGVFSFVDSNAMNFWIKGSHDFKRNSMDTGWEVLIGNTQTTFDLRTLMFFESRAKTSGNPKLRLVGYAITGLDQLVGYYLYAKATKAYNESQHPGNPPVRIQPILAPAD